MKYNYCLICNVTNNLTRHHVIPKSITKHISNYIYQDKDIVCLCESCHKAYHITLDRNLAKVYAHFNLNLSEVYKNIRTPDYETTRRKITALRKDLPNEVKVKYLEEIKLVFVEFTKEQLGYYEQVCIKNRLHFSAEKYLVDNVNTNDLLNYYRNNFNNYATKRAKKLNK